MNFNESLVNLVLGESIPIKNENVINKSLNKLQKIQRVKSLPFLEKNLNFLLMA